MSKEVKHCINTPDRGNQNCTCETCTCENCSCGQ